MRCALLALTVVVTLAQIRPARACTIVQIAKGGEVLVGNNEDYNHPYTVVSFYPPGAQGHGVVFFGYDQSSLQGAVNDQGLFFDILAAPLKLVSAAPGKKQLGWGLFFKLMRTCTTVNDVLKLLSTYQLPPESLAVAQFFFGDASGDAVIVEAGAVTYKKGAYLVGTNFRPSSTPASKITCMRYKIADKMLGQVTTPSVGGLRRVMAAVHQEGQWPTQYTTIYDLKRGLIYLHHYHNFTRVKVLDIDKELAKGPRVLKIDALFGQTYAALAYEEEWKKAHPDPLKGITAVTLPPWALAKRAGLYRMATGILMPIFRDQQGLYLPVDPLHRARLVPISFSKSIFATMGSSSYVVFSGDTILAGKGLLFQWGQKVCSLPPVPAGGKACSGGELETVASYQLQGPPPASPTTTGTSSTQSTGAPGAEVDPPPEQQEGHGAMFNGFSCSVGPAAGVDGPAAGAGGALVAALVVVLGVLLSSWRVVLFEHRMKRAQKPLMSR